MVRHMGEIQFLNGTFNIQAARTVQVGIFDPHYSGSAVRNFTGEYYLEVTGAAIGYVPTQSGGMAYTLGAGRYLISTGNPRGQRSTTWGAWVDHYDAATPSQTQPSTMLPGDTGGTSLDALYLRTCRPPNSGR